MKPTRRQIYWISNMGYFMSFQTIIFFIDPDYTNNLVLVLLQITFAPFFLSMIVNVYKKRILKYVNESNLLKTFFFTAIHSLIIEVIFFLIILVLVFVVAFMIISIDKDAFLNWAKNEAKLKDRSNEIVFYSLLSYYLLILLWNIIYLLFKKNQQTQNLIQEKIENEKLLKEAQLENLSRQLNPHFLFNALSSIKSLVISNPEKSRVAITQLSDMLRYSLNYEKQNFVPLENEIDTIKDYLELEQMRFGDKLKYTLDIDHSLLQTPIPPIVLQGMVENAVKHGVAEKVDGGSIEVKVFKKDEQLCLQVSNTGSLIDKERAGIGLINTQQRLSILYGDKASFRLEDFDGFVIAQIKIPLHHEHN